MSKSDKSIVVILVAAGRGTRFGGAIPKQYVPIDDQCALRKSTDNFLGLKEVSTVLPVINAGDERRCKEALNGVSDSRLLEPAFGGETRPQSVLAGLNRLEASSPDLVLIHDAARPFVPHDVVRRVIAALDQAEGAVAALPVVDSLWSSSDNQATHPVSREGVWRAQTPQGFHFARILAAHKSNSQEVIDDVEVARLAGLTVQIVQGSEDSFKITLPEDLPRAKRHLMTPK